jgi:tetratricopeptide (TPR) repeat protein
MKYIIKIVLFLLIGSIVQAQDVLDSKKVNQKSLHHYYQKEWGPLIELGNKAIKSDIDFKLLRYRMGIAHYELGHYNNALSNFKKVAKETLIDTTLQEYLYYSYLSAGRTQDARVYAEKMDRSVRQKVGFQKFRLLDDIHLTVGGKFSALIDSVGHMPFVTLGMSHQIGTRFKYSHHFTFLTQNYLGLQYNQYEYYGKAEIALAKSLQLVGAFHFTGLAGNVTTSDSIFLGEVRFDKKVTQTGLVGLLGFQGDIGPLRWKAYGSIANWSTTTETQGRLILASRPPFPPPPDTTFLVQTMNLAMQFGLELDYTIEVSKKVWFSVGGHFAAQLQRGRRMTPIWGVRAYAQVSPKAGFGVNFMQANTTYFLVNDAAYTSNTIGTLNAQVGATFNYTITPKLNWYINYTYENRKTDNFNFDYHSTFTGLKFKL